MPKTGHSPLKWHGGKVYLAGRIWDIAKPILPHIIHCVETHCGGCAWTLKGLSRGYRKSFLINDIDGELMNFWDVLKLEESFVKFRRFIEAVPVSRTEWERSTECPETQPRWIRAAMFFIRCRQSLAGRQKAFTPPTRTRLRRGMNGNVSEWIGSVEGLFIVHSKLRQVFIESMDALKLIRREDTPQTLFYCDPPYLPESRTSPNIYNHEMTKRQHLDLIQTLNGCKGKVMLSGYDNKLYRKALGTNWNRYEFDVPNNSAGGKKKKRKTEIVWINW